MKKFTKTLLAAALLAGAGSASAALTIGQTGTNDMFLAVYSPDAINADGTLGLTYNLDLNITFNQLKAAPNLGVFANVNLASDSNWTAFLGTNGFNAANVRYVLATSDSNPSDRGAIITGASQIIANPDPTVLVDSLADSINIHASQINFGLGAGDSSLIKNLPDNNPTGQFTPSGLPANGSWNGWPHDPTAAYGSSTQLWFADGDIRPFDDGFEVVPRQLFLQADVRNLGAISLSGNTLSFQQAAAVPLPAAVWMFGAGLMGVLRANRRKAA